MSFRLGILPSLGMLGMDANPSHISMGYHPTFGPSKQERRLKIHFS